MTSARRTMIQIISSIALVISLTGCIATKTSSSAATLSAEASTTRGDTKNVRAAAGYNVQLGIGYLQQGNIQRAKAKLLLALKQAPNWPPALDAMGYFLEKTGEPEQAKEYYTKALQIAPHDGSVLNNYGTFLCRQKKYAEAEQYFLAAVKDPDYLTTAEAYENAGLCALEIPNDKKAELYFKKALLQEPQRLTSLYELAQLNFKQQQYQQTLHYIDTYLSITQGDAKILFLGYQAAIKLNDKALAARYTSLLRNNYPNSVEAQRL